MSHGTNDITGDSLRSKPATDLYRLRLDMAYDHEAFRAAVIPAIIKETAKEHSSLAVHECELKGMDVGDLWKVYEQRVMKKS